MGKVWLVTGASRGIGAQVAAAVVQQGDPPDCDSAPQGEPRKFGPKRGCTFPQSWTPNPNVLTDPDEYWEFGQSLQIQCTWPQTGISCK